MDQFHREGELEPFTKEEAQRAFAPDPEWDKLEAHMSNLPKLLPEED